MGNMEGNTEVKIMMDLVVSTLGQRKPRLPPTLNVGKTWLNHVKPASWILNFVVKPYLNHDHCHQPKYHIQNPRLKS